MVIPKPLLRQLGIEREVELELVEDHLEIRPASTHPRAGWKEAISALPESAFELSDEDRDWLDAPGPAEPL